MSASNSRALTPPSERPSPPASVLKSNNNEKKKDKKSKAPKEPELREDGTPYPTAKRVVPLMLSLYMTVFLVALDRTIIGTAIPRITDDFHSLGDVGWYGSAYLLTTCAFQLLYGRMYTFYSPRSVFLSAIFLFEVGSALCGAAPNSTSFIIGRALAGLGSSGIISGAVVILIHSVPLTKRPMYQGLIGAVFAAASVIGPLLGGVFTERVSWRWCFYINLPIGAVAVVVILLVLRLPDHKDPRPPLKTQIRRLDPLGTLFFMPSIICLLLALQWGGTTYAWNSARVIVLLVLFALLLAAFICIQIFYGGENGDCATIPVRMITQRSVAFGFCYITFAAGAMMVIVYYVPIWFQAVKHVDAVQSGIRMLPFILGLVVGSIFAGGTVTRTGYYTPFMYAGTILLSIGAGLISTFEVDTPKSKWIGYQALMGIGMGTGFQQPSVAVQAVLAHKDVPVGVSLMFFGQSFGGALFISVAQNLFQKGLVDGLKGIEGVDPEMVANTGATDLTRFIKGAALREVLEVYNNSLRKAFYVAVACGALTVIGTLGMEWKNLKKVKQQQQEKAAAKGDVNDGEEGQA